MKIVVWSFIGMLPENITIVDIKRWATSSSLDSVFNSFFDDDQDFDLRIQAMCDSSTMFEITTNRRAPKRQWFASLLVNRLVKVLYSPRSLPYKFSRFSGVISFEEYRNEEIRYLEMIHSECGVVEKMRRSGQEEVKNLGNMILDFRHDRCSSLATIDKLLQLLSYQIQQSFVPGASNYKMRICKICEDHFKSWVVGDFEKEPDECPFCKLKIQYPQKSGKNKGR